MSDREIQIATAYYERAMRVALRMWQTGYRPQEESYGDGYTRIIWVSEKAREEV